MGLGGASAVVAQLCVQPIETVGTRREALFDGVTRRCRIGGDETLVNSGCGRRTARGESEDADCRHDRYQCPTHLGEFHVYAFVVNPAPTRERSHGTQTYKFAWPDIRSEGRGS